MIESVRLINTEISNLYLLLNLMYRLLWLTLCIQFQDNIYPFNCSNDCVLKRPDHDDDINRFKQVDLVKLMEKMLHILFTDNCYVAALINIHKIHDRLCNYFS